MSENKQYPILEYVADVLQNAIVGSKLKELSANELAVLDGNAAIRLKQNAEGDGEEVAIIISDEKQILYSEDLLETIYKLHENTNFDEELKSALSKASIVINNLNVEAELIFYAVRDLFYGLSSSYEFVKFIERDVQHIRFSMIFGDHLFQLNVVNEPASVNIEATFAESLAPAVKETINTDLKEVVKQVNEQFKKD